MFWSSSFSICFSLLLLIIKCSLCHIQLASKFLQIPFGVLSNCQQQEPREIKLKLFLQQPLVCFCFQAHTNGDIFVYFQHCSNCLLRCKCLWQGNIAGIAVRVTTVGAKAAASSQSIWIVLFVPLEDFALCTWPA